MNKKLTKEEIRQKVQVWNKAERKGQLRTTYELNSNSVVIDLGAYKGDWALEMYKKYNCTVYCFEPVKSVYNRLNNLVASNSKIKVINCAVGDKDEDLEISIEKDASSFFGKGIKELVSVKNVSSIFSKLGIMSADLIKMNIENSEYEVLEEMIKSNMISNYRYYQIQFHRDADNAIKRRDNIRKVFGETHNQMWNHDFIWESWEKK